VIDLARVTLEDDNGESAPVGEGMLAAGARQVFSASVEGGDLPFGLASTGDRVVLRIDGQVVDEVVTSDLGADVALARFPDGGDWAPTAWPTPDSSNGDAPSASLDPTEALMSTERVWRIDVTITFEAYQDLSNSVWGNRVTVPAEFEVEGMKLGRIGMRLKGSASAAPMTGKPAFKLDFNQFVAGTRFRDLQGINLHNGNVQDPTLVRDHLTYSLARDAGLPAPRVGWAELWIHDAAGARDPVPYGLYVVQEDYDREFVDDRFPGQDDTSLMIEPNAVGFDFGSSWGNVNQLADAIEFGPVDANGDPTTDPRLFDTLTALDQLVTQSPTDANIELLWTLVDRENLLNYTAWEGLVNHFDGYMVNNNWRLMVRGSDARVLLVPSGAEWTWETDPVLPSSGALMAFCTSNDDCRREVAIRMLEQADRVEDLDLAGQFTDINEMLNPFLQADDRRVHSQSFTQQTRTLTRNHLLGNPVSARALVFSAYPDLMP
jgi:hypothetical protein